MVFERGDAALQEEFDAVGAIGGVGEDEVEAGCEALREFEAEVGEVGGYIPRVFAGGLVDKGQQAVVDVDDRDGDCW